MTWKQHHKHAVLRTSNKKDLSTNQESGMSAVLADNGKP